LAAHWTSIAGARAFPALDNFAPYASDHGPEQMIFWDVEAVEGPGGYRFSMRSLGTRAAEAFGNHMAGARMEQLVPPALRPIALDGARACANTGCAIYEIISTVNANGHLVDCERLLLPFGESDRVEQIVVSLQLI